MRKALGGFFWNTLLQPQRAAWNIRLHLCHAGSTAHRYASLPYTAAQRNLWIHLVEMIVPFLFLPFNSNACWNNPNFPPFVAAISLSQIQKSHVVCTQTSHYSLLSQSYKMSKNLIYLPLKHIIIIFLVQFLPFSPLVLIASQLP